MSVARAVKAAADSYDACRVDLAGEVLRTFGALRLRVTGSSMLPAIRPGDVLRIRHCHAADVDIGEVVLFARHDRLFAHRVVGHAGDFLVTQGDAISNSDPAVREDELLGRLVQLERDGRAVPAKRALTRGERLVAALVRRSSRAARLITRLHGLPHRSRL